MKESTTMTQLTMNGYGFVCAPFALFAPFGSDTKPKPPHCFNKHPDKTCIRTCTHLVIATLISFFTLLTFCLATIAQATTYDALELQTMLQKTDLAFSATVANITTTLRDDEPWTLVTFNVVRDIKGDLATTLTLAEGTILTLEFYGGTAQGRTLTVTGMPTFDVGETVLVLAYNAPYYSPVVGFSQGLWRRTNQGWEDEQGRLLTLATDQQGGEAINGTDGTDEPTASAVPPVERADSAAGSVQNDTLENDIEAATSNTTVPTTPVAEATASELSQEVPAMTSQDPPPMSPSPPPTSSNASTFPILRDGLGSDADAVLAALTELFTNGTLRQP